MHELTQTTLDETTLIQTSVDSYIFTCSICSKQARYGYSFENKVEVFCNGEDFGTKAVYDGKIIEENDVSNLRLFAFADMDSSIVPEELERMEATGLIKLVEDKHEITYDGFVVNLDVSKDMEINPKNIAKESLAKLREVYDAGGILEIEEENTREYFDNTEINQNIFKIQSELNKAKLLDSQIITIEAVDMVEAIAKQEKEEEDRRIRERAISRTLDNK